MKWVNEWDYREPREVLTTEQLVRHAIRDTEEHGELESIRNALNMMTSIVAKLVGDMPESTQKEVIKDIIGFGWKPKGD